MTCDCIKQIMTDLDPIAPTVKKTPMPPIDLTLAINFIPAVVCLSKAALISVSLSTLDPGEHLGGFVVFAMMLNVDRAVSCARIFDENAVQCCILAAWVINFLRAMAEAPKLVEPITAFLWLCFGYCICLEPKSVQEFFVMYGHGSGGVFKRVLPGVITSIFVAVTAFTPLKSETAVIKSARSIGFACLCVAWVYVVSIWRPKPRHNGSCVFECHLLLSRFCPILFVHWGLAVFYTIGCVVLMGYHYVQIHVSSSSGAAISRTPACDDMILSKAELKPDCKFEVKLDTKYVGESQSLGEVTIMMNRDDAMQMNTIDEEDEDLEAIFRSACQNRQPS